MRIKKHQILIWISVFAISMGIFEGSVVVYLRALYYPLGFNFPLAPMDNQIAITELIRELASLFMLLSVGIIAGQNLSQRFAWFIYSFAVWDLVYYALLYLVLDWPESLLSWDILFLLPVCWTGPVLTPVIISILMIFLAMLIYYFNIQTNHKTRITQREWIYLISGAFIVFISFVWDFSRFFVLNISHAQIKGLTLREKLFDISIRYIPEQFPWIIFIIGISVILFSCYLFYKRNKKIME